MKKQNPLLRIAGIVGLILLPSLLLAQAATGRVAGKVSDETGSVLPGANVTLKSVGTPATQTVISDPKGGFAFANLLPGNYEVTVERQGFSPTVISVTVTDGAAIELNPVLKVSVTEVMTVSLRESIEISLASKRAAETRVEVITSEDIGKMPDHNVADSLQRVAGVNISAASANEGAFDENDRVSMRGTSPSFTQTLIDGHGIASGDWFVLNQTGTVGRSVTYSLLPSELVQKVEVHKSSEARLVEGGAVGSVNIVTRTPLSFESGLTSSISLGMVYAALPSKNDPQLSALFNYTNNKRNFGIMFQAFNEERHLRRDGQELLGYEQIAPGSDMAKGQPNLSGVYYPTLIGSALFEQERKRIGGLASVEFKPVNELSVSLTGFTSRLKADNYNRNYMLWGARILGAGQGQAPDRGYVVRNNTLVSADFTPQTGRQYGIYDQISRPGAEASSGFLRADAQWDVSEKLKFTGQIGNSEGHGKSPTQDVAEWDLGLVSGAGWQLNGVGAANWQLGSTNTGAPGTPGTHVGLDWIFGFQNIDVIDKEKWLRFDGEYKYGDASLSSLQFGVREARHERNLDNVVAQGPGCINSSGAAVGFDWSQQYFCPAGTTSPFNPANWPQGFQNYPGNFGSGLGANFPRNIWHYAQDQLADYNELTNRDPITRRYFPAEYGVEERSTAAYAQLNFLGRKWSGNVGLRYVRTQEEASNWVNTAESDPNAITTSAFGPFRNDLSKNTYNDWLPSFNFKYNLAKNKLLRLAASRTLTRPDFSQLAGAVQLGPPAVVGGVGIGSGGNPDLEPILSTNLDATFEWYYTKRALLSASLFYMDIDNYVALTTARRQYLTIDANNPSGAMVDYDLTIPVGSSAKVQGFELASELPLGEHFGAFANFTYADGTTDAPSLSGSGTEDMLGTSKTTYNVGGFFENAHFNARLNYTYRSSFYSGLDRSSAFHQDAVGSVSSSVGYKINTRLSLVLDALNLNNPKIKYYAENRDRPRSIYENGRQYYLTLRATF